MQEETVEITLVPVNVWKNLVYTKQVYRWRVFIVIINHFKNIFKTLQMINIQA